ncbi:MAG TPA: hypothetical protein VFZ53_19670 [Polyangiaceae bacterium]
MTPGTPSTPSAFKALLAAITAAGVALGPLSAHAQQKAGEAAPTTGEASPSAQPAAPAAPSEEAIAEAARRYDLGLRLYAEGEFRLAVIEFERTYQITQDYRVLYNIGQVRIQLGNYARAIGALNEYLKQGGDKVAPDRKKAVESDLDMLAARTGHVRIVANVAGADILVDDLPVGVSPLAEAVLLDAGEHKITARKRGYDGRAVPVTLAGRDSMLVEIKLDKIPEGGSRVVIQQVDKESDPTWMYAMWSATGVLAVGAGVFGVLGIKEKNELEDLRVQKDPEPTRDELDDTSRRAKSLLTTADILGVAAVASGGIALYLTLTYEPDKGKGREKPPGTKPAAVKTGLVVGPNRIALKGEF